MYDNYKIMEHLKKELDKKAESGIRNITDLDTIVKLAQALKDLVKADYYCVVTEAMEEETAGYSQNDGYSERRKRDSMGRYSRNDGYDRGSSYHGDDGHMENGYSGAHRQYMNSKNSYRSSRSPESKKKMLEDIDNFMDEISELMQSMKDGADSREERERVVSSFRKIAENL